MDAEKVTIEAERLNLPATATAVQIRDAVYALAADRDKWRERAEENQKALVEARKLEPEVKKLRADFLIQNARLVDKIDKDEEEFYRKLYEADPDLCNIRLAGLRERRYLRTQESLKGQVANIDSVDPVAELAAKVAEVMANDKNLSQAEATKRVMSSDKELFERVRKAELAKASDGGND